MFGLMNLMKKVDHHHKHVEKQFLETQKDDTIDIDKDSEEDEKLIKNDEAAEKKDKNDYVEVVMK